MENNLVSVNYRKPLKLPFLLFFWPRLGPRFALKYPREFKIILFCFQMSKNIGIFCTPIIDFEIAKLKWKS